MQTPNWVRKQKLSSDFEVIEAKNFDDYKDFVTDTGCYVLVKVYKDTKEIGVGICNYAHEILKEFKGKNARDIYFSILDYSEKHNKKWFTRLDHAAYLGKELAKAQLALEKGFEYVQE